MGERKLSEGFIGLIKIFIGALLLGLLSAIAAGAPKGIAVHFAFVMSMFYCVVYIAAKAAYKDIRNKEGSETSGYNQIIDGH